MIDSTATDTSRAEKDESSQISLTEENPFRNLSSGSNYPAQVNQAIQIDEPASSFNPVGHLKSKAHHSPHYNAHFWHRLFHDLSASQDSSSSLSEPASEIEDDFKPKPEEKLTRRQRLKQKIKNSFHRNTEFTQALNPPPQIIITPPSSDTLSHTPSLDEVNLENFVNDDNVLQVEALKPLAEIPSAERLCVEGERIQLLTEFLEKTKEALEAAVAAEKIKHTYQNVNEIIEAESLRDQKYLELQQEYGLDLGIYAKIHEDLMSYYTEMVEEEASRETSWGRINHIIASIERLREDPDYLDAIDAFHSLKSDLGKMVSWNSIHPVTENLSRFTRSLAVPSRGVGATIGLASAMTSLVDIPGALQDAYSNYSELKDIRTLYKDAKAYLKSQPISDSELEHILKLIKNQYDFADRRYTIFIDLLKVAVVSGTTALGVLVFLAEIGAIAVPMGVIAPPVGVAIAGVALVSLGGYLGYKAGRKIYNHYKRKKWQAVARHEGTHYDKLRAQGMTHLEINRLAHAKLAEHDPYYSMLVLHDRLRYRGGNPQRIAARDRTITFLKKFNFQDDLLNELRSISDRNTAAYLIASKFGFDGAVSLI